MKSHTPGLRSTSQIRTSSSQRCALGIAALLFSGGAGANVLLEYQGNALSAPDDKLPAEPGVTAVTARIELAIDTLPKSTNTLFSSEYPGPQGFVVSAELSDGVNVLKWKPNSRVQMSVSLKTDSSGSLISWSAKAWTQLDNDRSHYDIATSFYMPQGCPQKDWSAANVVTKGVVHSYLSSTCRIGAWKVSALPSANAVGSPTTASLTPISAKETQALKAQGGGTPTSVRFINHHGAPVSVSWIDYSGQPKMYASLKPNETYLQATFTGHPWLVSDVGTGKPIEGFLPTAQQAEADIRDLAAIGPALQVDTPDSKKNAGNADTDSALIAQSIDTLFSQWASGWMIDRYVAQSSRVTEMQAKDGLYAVRGEFKFTRNGAIAAIPFSAALRKRDGGFVPINLCYNDTTSGMTDCTNSSTGPATRQVMRTIVLAGVLAALSEDGESPASAGSNESDEMDRLKQQRTYDEERKREAREDAEAQRENDDFWRRMNAPNQY